MNCVKCRTICKDFLKEVKTHLGLRVEKEFLIKERLGGKSILGRRNQHGQNQKRDTERWIVISVPSPLSFFSFLLHLLRSPFYRDIFPLKERSWREWNIILATFDPPTSFFLSTAKASHWYWLLVYWCLWAFYMSIKWQTRNREHQHGQGLSFPSF